jgi:hypothetical protein
MSAGMLPLTFKPQCCDSNIYVELGQSCAENFDLCWNDLRPMGAQFYFSLPFRLGLEKEWVIPMNGLVIGLSALASVPAIFALLPAAPRFLKALLGAIFLGIHLFFMGGIVRNSLSDLPAGVAALVAIWTLILAAERQRPWVYAAAGASLGLSAMIRAFFLYPSLVCAGVALVAALWRKETRWGALLFLSAFAFPVLFQMFFTNKFTHHWAFIDPGLTQYGEALHFETITYGYDTLQPDQGFQYDAPQCFEQARSVADAVRKHAWGEALCVVKYRQWFYFGSYTSWGEVYLTEAKERQFSVPFLLFNIATIVCGACWVLRHALRRPLLLAVFVFLGAIWGEGGAIIPETRFLIPFFVASWTLAVGGIVAFALGWRRHRASFEHWRMRLFRPRSREELPAGNG